MKTLSTITTAVTDWLAPARDALAQVRAAVEAEKARLLSLRAPRTDLAARRDHEIETLGRQWATGRGADLVGTLSGSMVPTRTGEVEGPVFHSTIANVVGELNLAALCFLAPEIVRAGMDRLLDAAPDYDVGPAMAGRAARLREVQAEIAVLEEQHQNLVDAAGELGLTIQPLESNRVRQLMARQREARERKAIDDFNTLNARAIARGSVKAATTVEEAR
jgi:hypothetical protein